MPTPMQFVTPSVDLLKEKDDLEKDPLADEKKVAIVEHPKKKTKKQFVMHEPSQLSVIADSAEVEVLLIDKANMHLFPEDVQDLLNERLAVAFSPDRPYKENIMDEIKDKFRGWDRYRIVSFFNAIKAQYNLR
jgi:hypothetical protein